MHSRISDKTCYPPSVRPASHPASHPATQPTVLTLTLTRSAKVSAKRVAFNEPPSQIWYELGPSPTRPSSAM